MTKRVVDLGLGRVASTRACLAEEGEGKRYRKWKENHLKWEIKLEREHSPIARLAN